MALKDKLMTLEDFKAVRDVDVASNSAQFTEIKADLNSLNFSHNVMPANYYSGDDYTTKGIHFVKNADGSVSSSGTTTDTARYYWLYENDSIPAGKYRITGIPSGSNSQAFFLQYKINDNSFVQIYTDAIITLSAGDELTIRTGYQTGYEDTGHTWRIALNRIHETTNLDSKWNPDAFIPLIYANADNGAKITNIENNTHWEYFDSTYEIGSLTTGGANTTSTVRIRSDFIPTKSCKLNIVDGYHAAVHYYATNHNTNSSAHDYWLTGEYTLLTTYPYFRYVVEKVPSATVAETDVDTYAKAVRVDVRTQLTEDIDSISGRVATLENADTLPDYWQTYLTTRIPQINDTIYDVGNHGIVFAFFTDYHYPNSDAYYLGYTLLPKILKQITDKCPIETIINGGDIITSNETRLEALALIEKFREDYKPLGVLNILGNHDKNHYGAEDVTDDDVYSILYRGMGMEKSVNLDRGMYWYLDNPTQKTRIIALNVSTETLSVWQAQTAQHQWFIDTLVSTPSGYTIVVMPHVFFALSNSQLVVGTIGQNIQALVDAYANRESGTWNSKSYDFTSAGGTVACILAGHTHNDGKIDSEAGYPMIAVVCDAMYGSYQSVTRGNSAKWSVAEHAFDIVCLDTSAKTISCVRVGSGSDRTYSYGQE